MVPGPDIARIRHDNALRLFEEFVQATVRHADAATLRGLERRFAERLQIQPSYWSQIKARSRQIGERLARQFEQLCHKPAGWMDLPQVSAPVPVPPGATATLPAAAAPPAASLVASPAAVAPASPALVAAGTRPGWGTDAANPLMPVDGDERFIVGLVLTYYRRHPQRARTRLLDLLGEALSPEGAVGQAPASAPLAGPATAAGQAEPAAAKDPGTGRAAVPAASPAAAPAPAPAALDALAWQRVQQAVAPLKRKR